MQSSEILRQLLSIVGTSKFTDDSRYYSKNDSNVPDLNIGSTYFYNRLRQKTPIIDRVKTVLKQIYSHVLSNMTDISDLATSEKLNSFFKEYIKIDTSCFVFWGDDSELLRKEKINSWLELLDIVLDNNKLFPFAVVPVLPFCNPRLTDVNANLTTIYSMNQLCKRTTIITVHFHGIFKFVSWQISQVKAEKLLCKGTFRAFGHHQGNRLCLKCF